MNTGPRVYLGPSRVTWPSTSAAILLVFLGSIWVGGLTWGAVAAGVGISLCLTLFIVAFDKQMRQIKKIEVSDAHVSGQSGSPRNLFRRISIPRSEIDFERSSRRSLWCRLFRCALIWSKDGRYIFVDCVALRKDQVRQILEDLGIKQIDV